MSITSRAARVDTQVARGTEFVKSIQIWTPDVQVPAESLMPGQMIFYEELPQPVYSVRVEPNWVVVTLANGLFSDPWFKVQPGQLVFTARPRAISWAKAAYKQLTDPPDSWNIEHIEIPNQIAGDTIELGMDPATTQAILPGPYAWDLVADVDGVRTRLMEGVMVVMTSFATAADYTWPPVDEAVSVEVP